MLNYRLYLLVIIGAMVASIGCDPKDSRTSSKTTITPGTGIVDPGTGGGTTDPPADYVWPILAVNKTLTYPNRICVRSDGSLLVSDPKVGSVFILDQNLKTIGELKNCGKPLAVAVDTQDRIYVGDNDKDRILVFDPEGNKIRSWGRGQVLMPNDMVFSDDGRLFVVDSKSNDVKIFGPKGKLRTCFGHPVEGFDGFDFPNAIAIGPVSIENSETLGFHVYVSDFMRAEIVVFTDTGEFVKILTGKSVFGGFVSMGMFGSKAPFSKIQAMEFDFDGVLHVLDCYQHTISMFDVQLNQVISTYGTYGKAVGQLSLPLDLSIIPTGGAFVTNANVSRVDRIAP